MDYDAPIGDSMRATILTKAHRANVSMIAKGVVWPDYCMHYIQFYAIIM